MKNDHYLNTELQLKDLRNKSLQSAGIMIISRSLSTFIQFFSAVILARLLTPEDFGLVAMVSVFSFLFYNIGFNGFTEAIVQARTINHEQVSMLFWIGILISISLALIFAACAPILSLFYKEPRVINIAQIFSIGFIFSALATEHLALIMRKMEFSKIFINEIMSVLFSTILAIILALKGFGYWSIVLRQLSIGIISAVLAWIQNPWRPSLPKKKVEIGSLIKFASNTFGIFSINYLARNIDKAILGWKCGRFELGNYDRAYRLFVLPVAQLTDPLSSVALSSLSKISHEPDKYKNYYMKSISVIGLIGMCISAFLTTSGQEIISILLGPRWKEAGTIFTIFGPAISMILLYQTISWIYLSKGKPGKLLKWTIISSVYTMLLYLLGVRYKGRGIALAYGISIYTLLIPGFYLAIKGTNISVLDILRSIWKYFISFLLSCVITLSLFSLINSQWILDSDLLKIIIKGFLATFIYIFLTIFIFKCKADIIYLFDLLKTTINQSKLEIKETSNL